MKSGSKTLAELSCGKGEGKKLVHLWEIEERVS